MFACVVIRRSLVHRIPRNAATIVQNALAHLSAQAHASQQTKKTKIVNDADLSPSFNKRPHRERERTQNATTHALKYQTKRRHVLCVCFFSVALLAEGMCADRASVLCMRLERSRSPSWRGPKHFCKPIQRYRAHHLLLLRWQDDGAADHRRFGMALCVCSVLLAG